MNDETARIALELSPTELQVVRTALRLLLSSLSRDEADEIDEVRVVLDKIERLVA